MANYGSNSLTFKIDLADAGSLVNISNFVRTINNFEIERLLTESTAFGDAWVEHLQTGLRRGNDIEIGGFYDDTAAASGPEGLNIGAVTHAVTRTVEITWGGSKTSTFEAWIQKYTRTPSVGNLTEWRAVLRPSGAVTEA
ncbi:MAG: hypothetical protein POELPBGB_03982 [Bacteroidia bacterium]|nr:hypothetical protein [Bacteroidia bacterium]